MSDARWFVHYTVKRPGDTTEKYCVAGPYTVDEVPDHRRDIAGYDGITDCYASTEPKHPKG